MKKKSQFCGKNSGEGNGDLSYLSIHPMQLHCCVKFVVDVIVVNKNFLLNKIKFVSRERGRTGWRGGGLPLRERD